MSWSVELLNVLDCVAPPAADESRAMCDAPSANKAKKRTVAVNFRFTGGGITSNKERDPNSLTAGGTTKSNSTQLVTRENNSNVLDN